jgi:CRP-like cAMP-binding protein
VRLGLKGLATRERVLVLEHFADGIVVGRVVEELLADADRLIDGTRAGGRRGYLAAAAHQLRFSRHFRLGHMLHRRFRIYFISSGVVEAVAAGQPFRLTRGDFFGEMALVLHVRRQANVTALTYCQLLVLGGRDLRALLRHNPRIKRHIDETASARARLNEQAARPPSPPGDGHERNQQAPRQGA